jgi:para-nitrobenzyl esterase
MTPLGLSLSQMGLVVVSANYRLGPFGFLAHPALTAESEHHSSGNYGLLDQLQALRWVKENIREFGGDPDRVTVMGQSAGAVDICLLMASPMSQGLFQGAILESGECQDTLNEDIRAPIKYNFIDTTGEASGERLARDLGVPSGPGTLRPLRQIPANEILNAWKNDAGLRFDAIVDGWVVPKQPAQIFAEGKQLHIPILVGSNADEATVFGHNDLKTVSDYKKHLQQDTGQYWKEEFQLYPVSSDADVPTRSVRLESDEFACGAYSIAQAVTKAGEKSHLYYFTYVDPGKRSRLGAHHGEELFFLSDSFPADWEHTNEDKHLGELLRGYWAEFAKTGDPKWPAFDSNSGEYFEIGAHVGLRPVSERIRTLETTMRRIAAKQN